MWEGALILGIFVYYQWPDLVSMSSTLYKGISMDAGLGYRPLYKQVYERLIDQIIEGKREPGAALPSEQALAEEFGVSQGTVRKALNVLTAEKIIERRQGKGSYVSTHTPEKSLFRFFRLSRPGGEKTIPQPGTEKIRKRLAKRTERQKLDLAEGAMVFEIRRTRLIEDKPTLSEVIVVPEEIFPKLKDFSVLPNALYTLYQKEYGIQIMSTQEEIHAVTATKEDEEPLSVKAGEPILQMERVAIALDGRKVEFRSTRCNTSNLVFSVSL